MISLEGLKSESLIKKIQSWESPPKNLENIFSETDLENLKKIADQCYQTPEWCQEKLIQKTGEPLGKMAHPKNEMKLSVESIVKKALNPWLDGTYEMEFTFHKNYFPYGIHTDSGYDPDEKIYKQGIIPLEVYPKNKPVYTVIFEQKSYHSVGFPRDPKVIENLTQKEKEVLIDFCPGVYSPSKMELRKYWDESALNWLNGFKIALPFEWKRGSMALWDRAHLHCSSDFEGHGIEGKLGLMWISRRLD
tara:strand:+ start:2116 stop:2859 length:744 start_codon:yes stop_codon:yes gene_type:complete